MSQQPQLRGGSREERKRYLWFTYIGGAFFFVLLVTTIIVRVLYSDPSKALISETADAILFEILLITAGTGFGSTVVGVVIDQYQRRFGEYQEEVNRFIFQEGVSDVFRSAEDPRLIQYLLELIPDARSEMVFIGLGLGILSHNREILTAIGERLNAVQSLRVGIYLGSANNEGVKNRIHEEKAWHHENKINYDETWVTRYPAEIRSVLHRIVNGDSTDRLRVVIVDDCPMCTVMKVDDRFLFFAYGSPNIRGSQSPWIVFDGRAINSKWVRFLYDVVSFYQTTYRNSQNTL